MIPKQISKEDVWRCIAENQQVYYANPDTYTCYECRYRCVNEIRDAIGIAEVIFFALIEAIKDEDSLDKYIDKIIDEILNKVN